MISGKKDPRATNGQIQGETSFREYQFISGHELKTTVMVCDREMTTFETRCSRKRNAIVKSDVVILKCRIVRIYYYIKLIRLLEFQVNSLNK